MDGTIDQFYRPEYAAVLVAVGAFSMGVYGLLDPIHAARVLGFPLNTLSAGPPPAEKHGLGPDAKCSARNSLDLRNSIKGIMLAYSSQNLAKGITIATMSYMGLNSPPMIARPWRRALGVMLLGASITTFVNSYCSIRYGADSGLGRKTGVMHFARGMFWVAVGVWCCIAEPDAASL